MRRVCLMMVCSGCVGLVGPDAVIDSGAPDASAPDAGVPDAGLQDAGTPDAGAPDSGTPDAGVPDAGPFDAGDPFSTDRNAFFGDARCADAGFVVCEDFESGNIDGALWQKTSPNNLAVDTAEHARGTHALHITQAGNGASYLRTTKPFPAPNNTYYGRAFFKFITLPPNAMGYAHWTVIAGSGSVVDGEIRVSGQLSNNRNLWGVGTDNRTMATGTGDWTTSDNDPNGTPVAVPSNQWLCIEWLHDGQNNETRFYWDDVEHPSLHTTPAMSGSTTGMPYLLPTFDNVWVGWAEYQTSAVPFELWVDEIAIDYARIGCVR